MNNVLTPSPLLIAALNHEKKKNLLTLLLRRQNLMKIIQRCKQWITSTKVKTMFKKSLIALGLMAILTEPAYALTGISTLDTVLEWLVSILTGSLARLIAIITVCTIGYKCKKEEISAKVAAIEIGGIAIIMGSTTIVDAWGIF